MGMRTWNNSKMEDMKVLLRLFSQWEINHDKSELNVQTKLYILLFFDYHLFRVL